MTRVLAGCLILALAYAIPASAQTGTVSGTVSRAANGTPVTNAIVYFCNANYSCDYVPTNASGAYTITAPPDTYYLYTASSVAGLIDEIYNNIPCRGFCDTRIAILSGTPIIVTSGATLSGRNFALDTGGTVTGTIVNAANGIPVAGAEVTVYSFQGNNSYYGYSDITDASGSYSIGGLMTGAYYLYTLNATGLVDEVYSNVPCVTVCLSMLRTSGQPVSVTQGATTGALNFALDPGGSVSGIVRNSATSAPLINVTVTIVALEVAGNYNLYRTVSSGFTNVSGQYLASGLPTGTYYAVTRNNSGFVDELYEGVPCPGFCSSLVSGTPIAVTAGVTTPGRNFDLEPGGVINGVVTRAGTSTPLANIRVEAYVMTAGGEVHYADGASTSATGAYSIPRLPAATYYLFARDFNSGYVSEIFDNLHCVVGCRLETALQQATGIPVTAGATIAGRNFALDVGGTLSGTIRSAGGAPIEDAGVRAYVRSPDGGFAFADTASTNASGVYQVTGLPTGSYYLLTETDDHLNELYNEVPCAGYCADEPPLGAGDPIGVVIGGATAGIDFQLDAGGRISGTVRNAATSAPLPDVSIDAYRNDGTGRPVNAGGASTNATGVYTIGGLASGEYFLLTQNDDGFHNQVYPGVNCVTDCAENEILAIGAPIAVAAGQTTAGRDFALSLQQLGTIKGQITNAATAGPAPSVEVYIYARVGGRYTKVASGYSDPFGRYDISDVPPGTYYASTQSRGQYVDEIHPDIQCPTTCEYGIGAVTLGAPISVGATPVTLNFALQPRPVPPRPGQVTELAATIANRTIEFKWEANYDLGRPVDYVLEVGFAPGTTVVSLNVQGTTYMATGVPSGRYFARVRARNTAGVGPASSEYEFIVNPDGSGIPGEPEGLEVFQHAGRLEMLWNAPTTGGVASGYVLEVGSATGRSDIASLTLGPRTRFTYSAPIPPGVYFVRMRARNAASIGTASREVMLVTGGALAPPDPPSNVGVFADSARRALIGWTPPRGALTGYVLEAGTALGRADVGVFPIAASMNTVPVPNVPPGTYYIRLRAVNAAGTGLPSYDTTLIVP
jgi:hypothetical protein